MSAGSPGGTANNQLKQQTNQSNQIKIILICLVDLLNSIEENGWVVLMDELGGLWAGPGPMAPPNEDKLNNNSTPAALFHFFFLN